ncbi:unnamed protein product, partial [Prorocentrum cordatum]
FPPFSPRAPRAMGHGRPLRGAGRRARGLGGRGAERLPEAGAAHAPGQGWLVRGLPEGAARFRGAVEHAGASRLRHEEVGPGCCRQGMPARQASPRGTATDWPPRRCPQCWGWRRRHHL